MIDVADLPPKQGETSTRSTIGSAVRTAVVPAVPEGYRAYLDGLRTVAVYLVLLFHSDIARLSGGFIGVDVFFVLSGYLVTQVLMRDLAVDGRVRFGRFYARRFRRLLPASALALVGTAIVYSWVVSPSEMSEAVKGFQAAFLYVANWFFIRESTDYFAAGQAESPVLHFWSLAVEEQFYLAWPLALGGLVVVLSRFGARMWTIARVVVAMAGAASLAWALHLSTAAPDRAYYGTDARVYQLLAGALVAMTPSVLTRLRRLDPLAVPVSMLALIGLMVASTPAVPGRPVLRGVMATVLTLALIVSVERKRGPVGAFLGWKPMVELGRISYGTYLWHWPVIMVLGRIANFSPWRTAVLAAGLSTGMAALSAVVVEMPLRHPSRLDRVPRLVVVCGLATSLFMGLLVVRPLAEASEGFARSEVAESGEVANGDVILTPLPEDFDEAAVYEARYSVQLPCPRRTGVACTVVEGDGAHVLLIGDSNAVMLQGAMRDMAVSEGLTLTSAATNGCAWQAGYYYPSHPDKRPKCEAVHDQVYGEVLDELKPDVVVAINVLESSTTLGPYTGAGTEASYRSTMESSVGAILDSGARLVVIEPMPRGPTDPTQLRCLGTASFAEECRFVAPEEPYWLETHLRSLDDERDDMWSVDMDLAVCPSKPICDPIVEGTVVRWDASHTTREFGLTLADDLAEVLRERDLLASSR